MKVTRRETLYQITFLPYIFPVNCYLIEEEHDLTLVDAALPYSAAGICQVAGSIGKPIGRIVISHAHTDHIGALTELKKMLPDAPIHISARDARLLAGDRTLEPGEPDTPIRGGIPKSPQPAPDVLLSDGDRVGSLLAVSAPGHTPGSMAFFDERTRHLIAGDAWQTQGGLAISGQLRLLFPFPAMATWNRHVAVETARKLVALRPSLLAVGHGPLLEDPLASMERAVAQETSRLEHQ